MPLRIETRDELGMNMTPMIDIVFNLVQFFMLTLDMSRKEMAALELPHARSGVPDTPSLTAAERRVVVNVLASGGVQVRGVVYDVSSGVPAEQARALVALRQHLSTLLRRIPRDAIGASEADVVVRGDRGAAWRRVQWVLQTLGDPSVRAPRVTFAVEGSAKEETNQQGR